MADLFQDEWTDQLNQDEDAVILDVRTQEEVDDGYIPGALHLDIYKGREFLEELEKLDKSKHYYIYCRSGNRSGQACTIMQGIGFDHTYNLLGGFNEWGGETVY